MSIFKVGKASLGAIAGGCAALLVSGVILVDGSAQAWEIQYGRDVWVHGNSQVAMTETYIVPKNVYEIDFLVKGGNGGVGSDHSYPNGKVAGGTGTTQIGTLSVTPGESLTLIAAGAGLGRPGNGRGVGGDGFGKGGDSPPCQDSYSCSSGGGGGGASAIVRNADGQPLVVSGGGGWRGGGRGQDGYTSPSAGQKRHGSGGGGGTSHVAKGSVTTPDAGRTPTGLTHANVDGAIEGIVLIRYRVRSLASAHLSITNGTRLANGIDSHQVQLVATATANRRLTVNDLLNETETQVHGGSISPWTVKSHENGTTTFSANLVRSEVGTATVTVRRLKAAGGDLLGEVKGGFVLPDLQETVFVVSGGARVADGVDAHSVRVVLVDGRGNPVAG